jgi:sugar transferase (PEP-CTERM/EpsH1 system associated)
MSSVPSLREQDDAIVGERPQPTQRVLFIAHRTPFPPNKGDKMRSFWELETLARSYTVDLFAFYDDPEDEKYFARLHLCCDEHYLEKLSPLWSRVRALKAFLFGRTFSPAFFYSKRMEQHIRMALAARSYAAIVVFSSSMAQYVQSFRNNLRILDLVDVDSDKWSQYARRSPWPLAWFWKREARSLAAYERQIVEQFSTTLVCTNSEAKLLRSLAPKGNIRVLENFTNVDSYRLDRSSLPAEIRALQPYLILSGSMDYFPNVDAATYFYREIFPIIRRQVPEIRFVIAGRKPHRLVKALAADSQVRVTGSVADIRPFIGGAAAAVVPMRVARGVQNKILEALASGVPVVSTPAAASALPENLRSLLTVADDAAGLAAAVVTLLRHGSKIRPDELRDALKRHFETLDLNAQLTDLIRHPPKATPELSHDPSPEWEIVK